MTHQTMESRGLRLHPALWAAIERDAKSVRLKPTDYLRRRIEDIFQFDPDGHNLPSRGQSNPGPGDADVLELPEEVTQ